MASSSSIIISHKYSLSSNTKPCTRFPALPWNPISRLAVPTKNDEPTFFGGRTRLPYDGRDTRKSFVVCASTGPVPVPPPLPPAGPPASSGMRNWIIGLVISFVLPFLTNGLGPLEVIKNKLVKAVQRVEDIVEVVEKVAENVDKIAENISDDLPQGKLRDLVDMVENVAEKTAKTADSLDDVIDKVQDVGDQMDDIVEAAVKESKASKAAKAG